MTTTEFSIPDDFFQQVGDRTDAWPDDPDVRRAVEWFRDRLPAGEWIRRRLAAAERYYGLIVNGAVPGSAGRFFDNRDSFGWYLFLAEAYIDHIWNYDPIFGSRVIPIFQSIGRDLHLLRKVGGIEARVERMVSTERAQPNGPLFEILVAAAYVRASGTVTFVPEQRGGPRTHDMDVEIGGRSFAVECKRMEVSDYGNAERERVRTLWGPSSAFLAKSLLSTFAQVDFLVPTSDVPDAYLTNAVKRWLGSAGQPYSWKDRHGRGRIETMNLEPLRAELADSEILTGSTRIIELLTGRYLRHQSMITTLAIKRGGNPRYAADCSYATVLEWNSLSDASISAQARDVLKKVSDACGQLPSDRPGIVHVGLEAVEGDRVEAVRHAKIVGSMSTFDPGDTPLECVYTHFLSPESPPDQSWAYDESTDVRAIRHTGVPPLIKPFLVLPGSAKQRSGGHWEKSCIA